MPSFSEGKPLLRFPLFHFYVFVLLCFFFVRLGILNCNMKIRLICILFLFLLDWLSLIFSRIVEKRENSTRNLVKSNSDNTNIITYLKNSAVIRYM
jgi:hypothetical protein